MVLGESCLIAGVGGIAGLAIGSAFLQMMHAASAQFFPLSVGDLAGPWMASIIVIALGIGFVSGIVPAVRAARLSVIDGLRRVV
jgi:putative ABC transport system permease protein